MLLQDIFKYNCHSLKKFYFTGSPLKMNKNEEAPGVWYSKAIMKKFINMSNYYNHIFDITGITP